MQPCAPGRRSDGASALPGGSARPGEAPGAIAAAIPVARVVHQSALSAPPPPILHRQDISGLLPRLSPENRSSLRNRRCPVSIRTVRKEICSRIRHHAVLPEEGASVSNSTDDDVCCGTLIR